MASGLDLTYLRDDEEAAAASSMGSIGFRANTSDTTNDTSYSNSRNEFAGDSSTGIGAEEEQQQQDVYRTLYENPAAQTYMMDGSEGVAANGGGSAMGDLQQQANDAEQDSMRPWTELKTKAGKERKRLPLACIVCRRKKIRCSGEKPACKHCYRSRIPCVYKVTTRKAAPKTE
ncbi:hypothetical protein FQN49_001453 [Arthroderma sp. PD_2]|nr:hypothetical protein FQN49_001453 [Arthroderma sp. PD_2]